MSQPIKYYHMDGCGHCVNAKPLIEELKKTYVVEEIDSANSPSFIEGYPTMMIGEAKYQGGPLTIEEKNTVVKWIDENNGQKIGGIEGRKGRKKKKTVKHYPVKTRNKTRKITGPITLNKDKKMTFTPGRLNGVDGIFLVKYKRTFIPKGNQGFLPVRENPIL